MIMVDQGVGFHAKMYQIYLKIWFENRFDDDFKKNWDTFNGPKIEWNCFW